jgi:hypothetical protein
MHRAARRLSPADRDRAVGRLRALTIGTTVAGVAAVGGFGSIAALSNHGVATGDVVTAAVTAETTTAAAMSGASTAAAASPTAATATQAPATTSAPAVSSTTGAADATTGGS